MARRGREPEGPRGPRRSAARQICCYEVYCFTVGGQADVESSGSGRAFAKKHFGPGTITVQGGIVRVVESASLVRARFPAFVAQAKKAKVPIVAWLIANGETDRLRVAFAAADYVVVSTRDWKISQSVARISSTSLPSDRSAAGIWASSQVISGRLKCPRGRRFPRGPADTIHASVRPSLGSCPRFVQRNPGYCRSRAPARRP